MPRKPKQTTMAVTEARGQTKQAAKPLKAMPAKARDRDRETSTAWLETTPEEGTVRVTATTHPLCGGHGCDECGGWGFTKSRDVQRQLAV